MFRRPNVEEGIEKKTCIFCFTKEIIRERPREGIQTRGWQVERVPPNSASLQGRNEDVTCNA